MWLDVGVKFLTKWTLTVNRHDHSDLLGCIRTCKNRNRTIMCKYTLRGSMQCAIFNSSNGNTWDFPGKIIKHLQQKNKTRYMHVHCTLNMSYCKKKKKCLQPIWSLFLTKKTRQWAILVLFRTTYLQLTCPVLMQIKWF